MVSPTPADVLASADATPAALVITCEMPNISYGCNLIMVFTSFTHILPSSFICSLAPTRSRRIFIMITVSIVASHPFHSYFSTTLPKARTWAGVLFIMTALLHLRSSISIGEKRPDMRHQHRCCECLHFLVIYASANKSAS